MKIVIHPTYFPNVAHFAAMLHANEVIFEQQDNYQKQTHRNRTYIHAANGKLQLSVPVIHTHNNRQKYKDIVIFNDEKWQLNHWKSIETAYRTSPFFEFYEDELKPLFFNTVSKLFQHNINCMHTICNCMQLTLPYSFTKVYNTNLTPNTDFRYLANSRKEKSYNFQCYSQVFQEKNGFIANLSILDVLFNLGPESTSYLKNQFQFL